MLLIVSTKKGNYQHGTGEMKDKCKFKSGEVVFCGEQSEAVKILQRYAPAGSRINFGTATAGDKGTATAGYEGTATAGDRGTIIIKYWNGKRYKYKIGYVGEDVRAGVKYRLNSNHEFEEVL